MAATRLADAPARGADRAGGAQPDRRSLAEPSTRAERHAATCVLHAAGGRATPEPVRLQIDLIRARLRAPFVSSARSLDVRELLLVRLEAPDGAVGYGEAAPLGVPTEEVRAALEDCQGALAGELAAELPPPARSAIDLAMWDLAGRRADQPVWRLLGASATDPVEVNYTIAAASRDGAAGEASAARVAGFGCAKVKVGLGDDTSRLAAVRAATGPDMRIRLDANGAWSAEEALAALDALAPTQIE